MEEEQMEGFLKIIKQKQPIVESDTTFKLSQGTKPKYAEASNKDDLQSKMI